MKFPFAPAQIHIYETARVTIVHGVGHHIEEPRDGYSKDWWYFDCEVDWGDGKKGRHEIQPFQMWSDTPEGHNEIVELSGLMSDYLKANGKYQDEEPRGWFAHRKETP